MEDIQSIVNYYVNLIIIQYNNKENAKGTISALASSALADGIVFDVRDGFSIDTAVGVQLDILGKYIGIDRFYLVNEFNDEYFGFADSDGILYTEWVDLDSWADGTAWADIDDINVSDNIVGFDDSSSPSKTGLFLSADEVIADETQLNDDTYRTLLKLKIIQNHSNHSFEDIAAGIYAFFADDVILKDNYNMTMTYLIGDSSTNLIKAALQKDVFPRPIGVGLQAVDGKLFFGLSDATKEYTPDYLVGFNDSTLGLVKDGFFLNSNRDIITTS